MRRLFLIFSFTILVFPSFVFASLVNINTANVSALQKLHGIGTVKAQKIIDYRNTHGAFISIDDIKKVSGIGNDTYARIADSITVNGSSALAKNTDKSTNTDKSSVATVNKKQSNVENQNYSSHTSAIPTPSKLSVTIESKTTVFSDVPFVFMAKVKTDAGIIDTSARISWSFGDGSASEGRIVSKNYHYSGKYRVVAIARDGEVSARDEITISVVPPEVSVASVSVDGVILENNSDIETDLSGWSIISKKGVFRIPVGTTLLPKSRVLFPFSIMRLPVAWNVKLVCPDSVIASEYKSKESSLKMHSLVSKNVHIQKMKPLSGAHGFNKVSGKSFTNTNKVASLIVHNTIAHDIEAVKAPTRLTKVSRVGAPLGSSSIANASDTKTTAPLSGQKKYDNKMTWLLSVAGIFALAGGAFVIL
ncbi:MAG TPA: hypothetical protein ENJ75_00335 [Candidatus Kaiserbacteria bacterium]|nr:hypothetical protein [Candidatus Kaiserbacteria bacterium]